MSTSLYQTSENLNQRTRIHQAALAYAKKGTPVFPCKPGGKKPLINDWPNKATTDPRKVNTWWDRWPEANIGIPTGRRSGLLVLDEDRAGALSELPGELPATTTARTGSGGRHVLLAYPPCQEIRNSAGMLAPGLDVRGEGGYIIAAPSRTESPYEWIERRSLADTPEWLLELLREPKQSPEKVSKNQTPAQSLDTTGGKIPDGRRNVTLTSIAGRLHDGTRTLDQLTGELLEVNAARCTPPLPDNEVLRIGASIHRRPPANQSKDVEPEVLEELDRIEAAHLWGRKWKGNGEKTPRSLFAVLIKEARRHGEKRKDGVFISMSVRDAALAVEVNKDTIARKGGATDKLRKEKLIRTVKGSGTKSGGFVLLTPRAKPVHSPTEADFSSSVRTLRAPLDAPRLRYSKPVYESVDGVSCRVDTIRRLGKTAEAIVDILERERGWMSVPDLGAALGLKRHRDLRRRTLHRLTLAAVVEWSDDSVRLRLDWLSALNRKREEDEEIKDHERDRKKYEEQRKNYRDKREVQGLSRCGLEPEEIAAAVGIGIEDVRRHLGIQVPPAPEPAPVEAHGRIEELEPVEDPKDDADQEPATPEESTDPSPEDFLLADIGSASGMRYKEMLGRWEALGGVPEDLNRAIELGPWRFEPEPLDFKELYVYPAVEEVAA